MASHPYKNLPERSFWRPSIAERHFSELDALWKPLDLSPSERVATAGSCFAQHIGRNLALRGANFIDLEPAPPLFSDQTEARRWGFGVFSCRYGNIYTARQLVQLFDEAFGDRRPAECVWLKKGRFFDALRPGIDPVGQENAETVLALREKHLQRVREMFESLDLFVFTLGLTEGWVGVADETVFPTAPGTIAGSFMREKYRFHNFRHSEILADMEGFWARLKRVNPGARMLLTVSPVPLNATASEDHVLCANFYSKSVLRSVAGELSHDYDGIYYFPSYEVIMAPNARGAFFDPDQRSVNQYGVDLVMSYFFSGSMAERFNQAGAVGDDFEVICDEDRLDSSE